MKLDFKKFLGWALAIGITAGSWSFVSSTFNLTAWTAFIGWSIYFFEGGNFAACKRSFPCIVLGALLAYVTVYILGAWKPPVPIPAILIGLLAFTMTYAQTIPIFGVASATFIGCSHYFGSGSLFDAAILTSVGLLLGLISTAIANVLNGIFLPAEKK